MRGKASANNEKKKTVPCHRDCGFCVPYTKEHLDYEGRPVLGSCKWNEHFFIMNDNCSDCRYFIRNIEKQ